VADIAYVRRYFSDHADRWLADAYGRRPIPTTYPVGMHRVRLAIEAVARRVELQCCRLVDLGCGGGELCVHVAQLGGQATGVDIAEGMIAQAEGKRQGLSDDLAERLRFIVADVLDNRLPAGGFDAVTALGLIEYLPEDQPFFNEANRLLRPGGVLVVSCRNRLFNLASLNQYTQREIDADQAGPLLSEIVSMTADLVCAEVMAEFVARLKAALPRLEEAIQLDLKDQSEVTEDFRKPASTFGQARRQHTPMQLQASARSAGFVNPQFFAVHPHPLPPRLEKSAPRFYNQLAGVFEVFERLPVSLTFSSAFIAVFTKAG